MNVVGAFDPDSPRGALLNHLICRRLEDAEQSDAFLVTAIDDPWIWAANFLRDVGPERVLIPDIWGSGLATGVGQQV